MYDAASADRHISPTVEAHYLSSKPMIVGAILPAISHCLHVPCVMSLWRLSVLSGACDWLYCSHATRFPLDVYIVDQ